jgi:peptidoglycan/xylan/chitin deacetylase (PgdA/CDA1 family)
MRQMQSQKHVIGGHTRSHLSLINLDRQTLKNEIQGNRDDLLAQAANPVLTFAYPRGEGSSDDMVIQSVKDAGYIAARSTRDGFNFKDTNHYQLRRQPGDKGQSFDDMKRWVDEAIRDKKWLILVFHQVSNQSCPQQPCYRIKPGLLKKVIKYVADRRDLGKLQVVTNAEGIALMN